MNQIILKWKQIYAKGINSSTGTKVNALFFADGEVATADPGGQFTERSIHASKNNKKFWNGNITRKARVDGIFRTRPNKM